MNNFIHKLSVGYQNIVSSVKAPLKESVFYKEGKLTAEEYIAAGDFLTQKCPTWKWCGASKNKNPCLPDDKQYLKTSVPCSERASDYLNSNLANEKEAIDGWVEADLSLSKPKGSGPAKQEKNVMDLDDDEEVKKEEVKKEEEKKESAVFDLDDDEVAAPKNVGDFCIVEEEDCGKVLKTRTYDVSVTYDLFYCVPRMWLIGYSEKGDVLTTEEMTEDIMPEYRNKTVTIEPHPITGVKNISVHPCRHSMLLKKMIETFDKSGKKLEIYMSIILFLKFLHSVVPTIQYDFTMDISF